MRLEEAVGIDIGSRVMKIAYVENIGGILRLTHAITGPTPEKCVEGGIITQPEPVGRALKSLLASAGITAQQAIAAVSGQSLVVRNLRMPMMREAHIERAVRVQVEELVPFPLADAVIEHCIIRRDPLGVPPGLDIAVVVVPYQVAESRVAALEQADLEPAAVDIEPFAEICSLLEVSTHAELRRETVAIVDLGAASSEITIVSAGRIAMTRALTFGGDALTRAIAATLRVSEAEAEPIKVRDTVAVGLDEVGQPNCAAPEASTAMAPLMDSLSRQISQTLNSYRAQIQGQGGERSESASAAPALDRLLLTGGTALLAGLPAFLEERLGTRTELANVFRDTAVDCPGHIASMLQSSAALFPVALGLTLREHVRRRRHEWLVAA